MKVVYLVLAIITSEGYDLQKLKFETTLTCDEIHEAVIQYKDIGERTYPIYQNKITFAHWCEDQQGNYYLGYEYE